MILKTFSISLDGHNLSSKKANLLSDITRPLFCASFLVHFLIFDLIRVTFIGLLIVSFHNYPYFVTGTLTCTIITNFIIILFCMPYKDIKYNLIMLLNEFLLIITIMCLFIISFYDAHEYFVNYTYRD